MHRRSIRPSRARAHRRAPAGRPCPDARRRRQALDAGGLSPFGGMNLANLLRAESAAGSQRRSGKAKSVIMLYLHGGAPTQDMFDMKPAAPVEVRGEFKPIATNVPGINI